MSGRHIFRFVSLWYDKDEQQQQKQDPPNIVYYPAPSNKLIDD